MGIVYPGLRLSPPGLVRSIFPKRETLSPSSWWRGAEEIPRRRGWFPEDGLFALWRDVSTCMRLL